MAAVQFDAFVATVKIQVQFFHLETSSEDDNAAKLSHKILDFNYEILNESGNEANKASKLENEPCQKDELKDGSKDGKKSKRTSRKQLS